MTDSSLIPPKAFISDEPEIDKDYFKRLSFAQLISKIIISRKESNSIVVGIYGKWGEGKTTVLNFIEKELRIHKNIVCIRYNPWYYSDEVMLFQDFFDVLADELGRISFVGNLKSQVRKYGKRISRFAASKSTTVSVGILQLNPFLSDSFLNLAKSKEKIQTDLKRSSVRIVVLMDDIDRLDKTEIQSVFKLVKLSADFDHLDYILAFDEEMVSCAIGEKYGFNDVESGRSFLEKIINVPLHLPQIGETALYNYLHKSIINNIVPIMKHRIEEKELEIFFNQFKKGLQVRLKTPRMAKRYQNALIFALPILEDEVNVVDLMLIEGIRVFYPKMYDLIKDNAAVFLNSNLLLEEELKKQYQKINTEVEILPFQEQDSIRDLIAFLFPRSQRFLSTLYSSYPDYNQEVLSRKKRIASLHYFNRYFSYAIPTGDISDLEIDSFIESISRTKDIDGEEIKVISSQIKELIKVNGQGSTESFISKIYRIRNKLDPQISQKLVLAISNCSDIFPERSGLYLISDLLQTMPKDIKTACSKKTIESTKSLCFGINIYYAVERKEMQFPLEVIDDLRNIIISRINDEITSESEPIYVRYSCGALILRFLRDYGWKGELGKYIVKTFSLNPIYSLKFLESFYMIEYPAVGERRIFTSDNYDSIKEFIDPDILYNALFITYADILENPVFNDEDNEEVIFLKNFSKIHNGRKKINSQVNNK